MAYIPSTNWFKTFKGRRALWLHGGNPKSPHVILTTDEMHSDGFANCDVIMEDAVLFDQAMLDLMRLCREKGLDLRTVDRVVGPAMGAVTMVHDMAYHIATDAMREVRSAYVEKDVVNGEKTMVFRRRRIRQGERVLLVEDVFRSGQSTMLTAAAVREAGGILLPFVAAMVNRSGKNSIDQFGIVSLIEHDMPRWTPSDCPLCKSGSEALRPKGENWPKLMAES